VLKGEPTNVAALLVKARFLMTERKLDEGIEAATRAVAADGSSVQARFLLASLYRAAGDADRAIPALQDVLALNPRVSPAWVELVRLTLAQGLGDVALQRAREGARYLPGDPEIRLVLARSQLSAGQVEPAGEILRDLATRFPSSADVLVLLAAVQARDHDDAAAERSLTRAFELDRGNLEAAVGLSALDLQRNRPAAARARAAAVLQHAPKSGAAHVFAARVAAATGDGQASEGHLAKALDLDPSSIEAYDLLGRLYVEQNRLAEARQRFETLSAKEPDSVVAHTMVALIDDMQGKTADSRRRYEHILQIDPAALLACNNLAYMYAEENAQLDAALQLARRARLRRPDAPQVADTLGWVYYRKGLARQAVPLFQQAVAQQPQNPTYQYHLALAYRDAGDARSARVAFEHVLSLDPKSPEAADARAALASK
jgi:tetratricopeptide (TPR) repeat protein